MDFEDKLKKAILRGQNRGSSNRTSQQQKQLSLDELKNRHSEYRLSLSDYIEQGLKKLCEHFPGFEFETIYGERGWGGAIYRDDIRRDATGKTGSFYSRLEITVRPINEFNVLNIVGKGTIQNKEIFAWNFFKDIPEVSTEEFQKKTDTWILLYAEKFASM
jgi:hypothetical protein